MKATPRQIIYYQTPDGKTPFSDWFNEIRDAKIKKTVLSRLERVADGNYGDCKSVGEMVLELRFKASGVRIYFAEIEGLIVLFLCAGNKASQVKDIAKAKEYWTEYNSRADEGV